MVVMSEVIWYQWLKQKTKNKQTKKNPLANAGDVRDVGSIPGSGSSLEVGMENFTDKRVGYGPQGHKELDMTEATLHIINLQSDS